MTPISSTTQCSQIYRNNLKNRDCGKEAPQNCDSERATIAQGQGASENRNFEVKSTQPNPDSSDCFGITPGQNNPLAGVSTGSFFLWLHHKNTAFSMNIRGMVNHEYNRLLAETGIKDGKIPGSNLEELGMDKSTPLRADLYGKAYGQVIAQWNNPDCLPFENPDIFRCTAQFMGYGGIFLCAQVCKLWNETSKHLPWKQFFANEGIPLVEKEKRKKSNYKEEFRVLCPMTINLRMIEEVLGRVVDEIPRISRDCFEKCYEQDPFEPINPDKPMLMMHTFKLVVIPASIERTSCKEFLFILDEKGNLQPVELGKVTGEKLQIPLGIRNLKTLCENSLAGKENMRVFSYFLSKILDQCNTFPDKMHLCFMRTCIAEGSRGKSYDDQRALVERAGFGVTSLKDRVFFDVVCILRSGTCPDGQNPSSYARTSDSVVFVGGTSYQLVVGGFAPRAGASVLSFDHDRDSIGVAPGIPAEVRAPRELNRKFNPKAITKETRVCHFEFPFSESVL